MAVTRVCSWGGVGDAILLTPALRKLKQNRPSDRLIVYCEKPSHLEVLKNNPYVNSLRMLTRITALSLRLFRRPVRVAPLGNMRPGILYDVHASHIIGSLIGITLDNTKPELYLTDREEALAKAMLEKVAHPRIAIHTTSNFTSKNWMQSEWAALVGRNTGYRFVQIGGANEKLVEGAVDMMGTPLRVAFALIGACDALVGVDSAMAHAATAMGIPSVVLFGASSSAVYGHIGNIALSANSDVRCPPCLELLFEADCPFDNKCMRAINAEVVSRALESLLAARSQFHAPDSPQVSRKPHACE